MLEQATKDARLRWDLMSGEKWFIVVVLGGRRMSPEPPAVLLFLSTFVKGIGKNMENENRSSPVITRERGGYSSNLFRRFRGGCHFLAHGVGERPPSLGPTPLLLSFLVYIHRSPLTSLLLLTDGSGRGDGS